MTVDWKKVLILNLPYLLFVYLFDKLCQAVRLAPGLDASEKFLHLSQGFTEAFSSGLPSLHPLDLLVGIAGAVIVRLAVYAKGKNARKYRRGIEYGSARWGTAADIAPYVDPVPDWNIPLTQTEKLTMSSRPKNPKYARNKNILVIGGSGSGKTRFFVKPSLMQMHSSYVVTDPKGQLLSEVGTMLRRGAPKLDENGKPLPGILLRLPTSWTAGVNTWGTRLISKPAKNPTRAKRPFSIQKPSGRFLRIPMKPSGQRRLPMQQGLQGRRGADPQRWEKWGCSPA